MPSASYNLTSSNGLTAIGPNITLKKKKESSPIFIKKKEGNKVVIYISITF